MHSNVGVSVADLAAMQTNATDWIISNLLPRQNLMILAGEPKRSCKSWLVLNLAWDLSEAKPVWNVEHSKRGGVFSVSKPMRSLYFAQEDSLADAKMRIDAMIQAGRAPTKDVFIYPKDPALTLSTPEGVERICEIANDFAPLDVLIFDPLRNCHTGDENDSAAVARILRSTACLQQTLNCSVILVHHERKPSRDSRAREDRTSPYALRGSTALYGGADAIVMAVACPMRANAPNEHRLSLSFTVKRAPSLAAVNLNVDTSSGSVSFAGFGLGRARDSETCHN